MTNENHNPYSGLDLSPDPAAEGAEEQGGASLENDPFPASPSLEDFSASPEAPVEGLPTDPSGYEQPAYDQGQYEQGQYDPSQDPNLNPDQNQSWMVDPPSEISLAEKMGQTGVSMNPEPPMADGFPIEPGEQPPVEGSMVANTATHTIEVPVAAAPSHLQQVRQYSESAGLAKAAKAAVPASFPFSLQIEGELTPLEKEKLLDLISRENMGFREVDLEPQLNANRILIPRISEYAGVLIVQTLRGARVSIRLGPSDTIFATEETRDPAEAASNPTQMYRLPEPRQAAEDLPLSTSSAWPEAPAGGSYAILDVIVASTSLKSDRMDPERSHEYQEVVEALQREVKFKAYHRGAAAVIDFKIQLTALNHPPHYKLMATGTALRWDPA